MEEGHIEGRVVRSFEIHGDQVKIVCVCLRFSVCLCVHARVCACSCMCVYVHMLGIVCVCLCACMYVCEGIGKGKKVASHAVSNLLCGVAVHTLYVQVELVKKRCLPGHEGLNLPMLEEYDFRNDRNTPDLNVSCVLYHVNFFVVFLSCKLRFCVCVWSIKPWHLAQIQEAVSDAAAATANYENMPKPQTYVVLYWYKRGVQLI